MGAKEPPREETYVSRDEEIRPDVFEVSGSIKWFDPSKGYGFILPDEDLPDVLLHEALVVLQENPDRAASGFRGRDESEQRVRPGVLQHDILVVLPRIEWLAV